MTGRSSPGGRPLTVERKKARGPGPCVLELGDGGSRSLRSTSATGCRTGRIELLAQVVVAAVAPCGQSGRGARAPVTNARVHEAVVDADTVHPHDPFGGRRFVQRVQRPPGLRRDSARRTREGSNSAALGRSSAGRARQQVARDPECEHVDAGRQPVSPRRQRMLARRVRDGLPVRVDVDDHGPLDRSSNGQPNVTPLCSRAQCQPRSTQSMEHLTGPLIAADEGFCHQVTETFATTSSTDPSWTEKVCAMAAARDGIAAARFRVGEVHQPQRHGRVRGNLARRRTDHGPRQPTARTRPGAHRHRADPLRGRRTAERRALRVGAQRRATDRVRLDLRGGGAGAVRGPNAPPVGVPGHRRPRPVPPDRRRVRMGRARRRSRRNRARRVGVDPRPLVGRALRRRCRARRCATTPSRPGKYVPLHVVTAAHGTARRKSLRRVPQLRDQPRPWLSSTRS